MARHNRVSLLGVVEQNPRIVTDSEGNYIQGLAVIKVVRGPRDVGDHRNSTKYDLPLIWSFNPEIIEKMDKWQKGDAVSVKGTINTKAVTKASECKHCHARNSAAGVIVYINPIHLFTVKHLNSEEETVDFLRANAEISNDVQLIGTVVREPKKLTPLIGLIVSQYQIALNRKYMIATDPPEIRSDYPWVKSYGDNAISDKLRLHVGSEVFIDGCIQARNIMRHATCSECGEQYEWKDNAMEIVPFAVEYLTNYYTDDDIAEMQNAKMEQAITDVFSKRKPIVNDDELSEEDLEAGIDTMGKKE